MNKQLKFIKIDKKLFLKYWFNGWIYFWTGYLIFFIMYSLLHHSWLESKIVADAIGWTLNYILQRIFVFNQAHRLKELAHLYRYLFVESFGFVIDYLIIWGLKSIGITPYIGFFISSGFFTVWSYLWYKYFVFV